MVLGTVQWIALGTGCLSVALGVYSLVTNRLPRFPFRHRNIEPHRYGWGQLMTSVFVVTVALEPIIMELPYLLPLAVLMLGFGFLIAGIWTMHSGKQTQQSS